MKKLTLPLFFTVIFMSSSAFAFSLNEHKHEVAELEISGKGKKIEIELEASSFAVLGFEQLPQTEQERKKFEEMRLMWQNDAMTKLFTINPELGCLITETKFEQDVNKFKNLTDKQFHSEIDASLELKCAKEIKGSDIVINVKPHFPEIQNLNIEFKVKGARDQKMTSNKTSETLRF